MSSKDFSTSIKEIPAKTNKTKLFLHKLKHRRNLSTVIPLGPNNNISSIQEKKLFKSEKEEKEKKPKQKTTLFSLSCISLQKISSSDTNNKSIENEDTAEKTDKKKVDENSTEKKTKRRKSQSQKVLMAKTPNKKNNINIENKEDNDKDEIIISNSSKINDFAENYLSIPNDLNEELKKHELVIVSPNRNIEGNYSFYINGVSDSLKEFIELDYDSIFSKDNKDNVKYLYYTSPMDIEEDKHKKKLLLIDLDETLIHSEFRNKENYKILDLYTKSSKCLSKTFSYSDDNYIYIIDVFFRPYLQEFLEEVSNYFDLAIFTAAMKGYADIILDYIDPKNEFFQFRLYRDACIPIQQRLYIKDLRIIKNYDPSNVILMDNSLYSFMNQPSNGMLVNSFYTNHKDTQLISAKNFLINHIYPCSDVRKECEKWYHFTSLFYKGTSKEINED